MTIETFLLCDAATEQFGKLNILGAFDSITTDKLPTIHYQSSLCLRVQFNKEEEGKHSVKFEIKSPKKEKVLESSGDINVALHSGLKYGIFNLILTIRDLSIKEVGTHVVSVEIDEKYNHSIFLYVNKAEDIKNV
jgi:hypothetical protein